MDGLRSILLVDDDKDVLEPVSEMLELSGFDVTCACSGSEALKIVATRSFDAIVSDVRMDDGDGIHFLDNIRSVIEGDLPPFIFLTGYADLDGVDIYAKGALALFQKPLKIGELISVINRQFS